MTPTRTVTVMRVPLALACRSLAPVDLQILLALLLAACPRTGRVWTTPQRLAEEFAQTSAAVEVSLATLVARGHISFWSRSTSALALRAYDLGAFLVLQRDEAPDNLPVEPTS